MSVTMAGFVPHVTCGAIAVASSSTRWSYDAPGSLGSRRHATTVRPQSWLLGARLRPSR